MVIIHPGASPPHVVRVDKHAMSCKLDSIDHTGHEAHIWWGLRVRHRLHYRLLSASY